jgi:hypothetical protein
MVKPKSFRPWNPEQTLLLPPSPVDWLPENHLVFFLLDLAGELDLEEIHAVYRQKDPRGEKAYEPRMMVVLLLYAYCVGMPRLNSRQKPLLPRLVKGRKRLRRLSTMSPRQKPVATRSSASRHHAAAVVPANGQMTLRSWRSRRPRPQAWS